MHTTMGQVSEVRRDESGQFSAWIRCEQEIRPAPGQYVLARDPFDNEAVLATPLFAGDYVPDGFLALEAEERWQPGIQLELRGPLGHGFQIPAAARRVALVACAGRAERLMPLVGPALGQGAAVVLYCESLPRQLPFSLEAYPLAALPETLSWPDFVAADTPLASLGELGVLLNLRGGQTLSMNGQVLVRTNMPCAGIADCGICALPTRGGWKLACLDGPVFNLQALDWQAVTE